MGKYFSNRLPLSALFPVPSRVGDLIFQDVSDESPLFGAVDAYQLYDEVVLL